MHSQDDQTHALTPRDGDSRDIARYDDALSRLGEAAEFYVRESVLDDYHRKKSEGTKQAQYDDLAVFSRFLAMAGIERTSDELFSDPHAWAGMKASTVVLFRQWLYYGQPPR